MQDVLDMDLDFHESITGGSHVPSLPGQIHLQCRAPGSAFGKLLQSGWSISLYIYINPTSDTREVWKLFGYSKVQVWTNMSKNPENRSCHVPGRDTQGFLLRAGLAGLAAGLSGWPGREGRREGLSWINGSTVGHHYSLIYQCIYIYICIIRM